MEHKRLRLFWRRFALGGGATSRRFFTSNFFFLFLIYKQEMMVEIILFNKVKTPVGASSERLMSESLSRSFKRFVQTADSSDGYA